MPVHILGIRHHGPGSARNVKRYLESLKPDIVLIEGPPEADEIIQWVDHAEIKPPVAILCYQPDNPDKSVFYPFAEFSPEWQAMLYARRNKIHVRFIDLPAINRFALDPQNASNENKPVDPAIDSLNNEVQQAEELATPGEPAVAQWYDPITYLATAAGFDDGEKWWEHMFEYRLNNEEVFDAVGEAMTELRIHYTRKDDRLEQLREAQMRKMIRQAEKELFQNIVVVCGAWHVPALANMGKQKDDNDLLKGLPKVKVECTWIPWTYSRLSFFSGYGAGIGSPGWYEHLWNHPKDDGIRWMARVAKLFRKEQMDTSVAHVIESVRLAGSLASLRGLSRPGLEELNEATLSVLCNGEAIKLSLVQNELIVSNKIGEVPTDIPKPPLQLDIEKTQKRLRLPATADWKDYTLDLRKENDLERSVFLHRLQLLDIKWGAKSEVSGKGTFKEQWRLQWDPAFSIDIIDKGTWGNTVEEAASKYVIDLGKKAASLGELCALLESSIPAEIPEAIDALIHGINNISAASGDVIEMMQVIPGLVNVTRYGNVRKTDADVVMDIVQNMITRICISLPAACTSIDEDAAATLLDLFGKMSEAVSLLQKEEITQEWQRTLTIISGSKQSSPVIAGYSTRLLADYKIIAGDDLIRAFHFAMSTATVPSIAAAWLEGFLKGSGTMLLLDDDLWTVVNNWVDVLPEESFVDVLPLLRRTFANFSKPERRKLGEKVKSGGSTRMTVRAESGIDDVRARKGIDVVMKLFGYAVNSN